ncbi:hypothetical protein WS90_26470 [Burkholderia cepacia]|uniref:Uncharacterized protein n=1 Tax=Burkholderia cepacia TaxID=292 RepID=A0A103Z949_BURCE|nr:hypothetical protein WS90_26470 [Burkholderia cepacia]
MRICIRQFLRACLTFGDERRQFGAREHFEMQQWSRGQRLKILCFPVTLVLADMRNDLASLDAVGRGKDDDLIERP